MNEIINGNSKHDIERIQKSMSLKYPVIEEKITIGTDPFSDLVVRQTEFSSNKLFYRDDLRGIWLYQANCLEFMDALIAKFPNGRFDMIFANPPYFLSNGAIRCHVGKMVRMN